MTCKTALVLKPRRFTPILSIALDIRANHLARPKTSTQGAPHLLGAIRWRAATFALRLTAISEALLRSTCPTLLVDIDIVPYVIMTSAKSKSVSLACCTGRR